MNVTNETLRNFIITLAGRIALGMVAIPAAGELNGPLNVAQTYQSAAAAKVAKAAPWKEVDAGLRREYTDAVELDRLASMVVASLKANW